VSTSGRAATPLDAFHGDFLELGANGSVSDNEVHSPMLSRSGSNCSDDDSSQSARSRLWMEHLQVTPWRVLSCISACLFKTYVQASACYRVPLEVLVHLRGELTPTLIKDCVAVLKGAGVVPADVQITNDTVQRLVWLASVAAATIVPTYRNSLPLLLLPLLHAGMPNAAILSCFERLVGIRPPSADHHLVQHLMRLVSGVDPSWPFLQHQWKRSCQDCLLRPVATAVRSICCEDFSSLILSQLS
jgi:hypothetical protein